VGCPSVGKLTLVRYIVAMGLEIIVGHGINFVRDCRVFGLWSALKGQLARFGNGTLRLSVRNVGDVTVRRGDSDYDNLRQIFVFQEYNIWGQVQASIISRYQEILRLGATPLIIDAGANVGFAALWFAKFYPQATIVCVEPDAENLEALQTNIAGLKNISARNAAIGANPGFVDVNNAGLSWSCQTTRSESGTVPILTIDEIIAHVPKAVPFIVKVDIEGFEEDLFSANLSWLDETCTVFIEPHDWMKPDGRSSRTFQQAFGQRSFGMFIRGEHIIYVNDRYLTAHGQLFATPADPQVAKS
jgi:FkbM family methyltransferase